MAMANINKCLNSRKSFVAREISNMLEDLGELVRINTVFDPVTAADGAPFGEGPAEGLAAFLAMAEAAGMKAKNYDGYAGEITLCNADDYDKMDTDEMDMVGILGHIDVVDAASDWNTPPFEAVIENGKVYGRGTSDDKGPLVSSLYAMKYISENNLLPAGSCIRLIVGSDEEEGLQCIEYYNKHALRMPNRSFVPDGYFPLVNCEKGLIDFDLTFAVTPCQSAEARITALSGGSGRNIVAGNAACTIEFSNANRAEILGKLNSQPALTIEETLEGCISKASGVSTHAMSPEKGENAISKLIHALKSSGVTFDCQDFIDAYDELIGLGYNGERLGINYTDELSGELTFNVGTISFDRSVASSSSSDRSNTMSPTINLACNMRYPVSYTKEAILENMVGKLEEAGFTYTETLELPSLFIDRNDSLIEKLMEAYQEITGDTEHEAFSIGGATYARSIPNAVSFGPLFPYETELAHESNECLAIESLEKMTEIYILALEKLLTQN